MHITKQLTNKIKEISDTVEIVNRIQFTLSTKELIFYTIVGIVVCPILLSALHESGHAIMVVIFNGNVDEMAIFPASVFTNESAYGGYILWSAENITTPQIVLIAMAGSVLTAVVGIMIFFIGYKVRLRPVIELWALLYAIVFMLDIVTYVISDEIGTLLSITDTAGDWYVVFLYCPFLRYIIFPIVILLLIIIVCAIFHPKTFTKFTF